MEIGKFLAMVASHVLWQGQAIGGRCRQRGSLMPYLLTTDSVS